MSSGRIRRASDQLWQGLCQICLLQKLQLRTQVKYNDAVQTWGFFFFLQEKEIKRNRILGLGETQVTKVLRSGVRYGSQVQGLG